MQREYQQIDKGQQSFLTNNNYNKSISYEILRENLGAGFSDKQISNVRNLLKSVAVSIVYNKDYQLLY